MPKDKKTEHLMERRYEKLMQLFETRLKKIMDASRAGDRPMFTQELTEAEQIERYNDPAMKAELIEKMRRDGGEKAVFDYINRMAELTNKKQKEYIETGEY